MMTINPAEPQKLLAFAKAENKCVEKAMREDLANTLGSCDALLKEVLEYGLFSGGKRIRPLLTILSARICGSADDSVYTLAAAFEYLHVATLIHDDVIDHAKERRGRKSVVQVFGTAAAILAGDWLHARSMQLIGQLTGQAGLRVFCKATTAMVDGEFQQLRLVANCKANEEAYFSVIHKKTAGLIASACEIGGQYAGAADQHLQALRDYGAQLGSCFQVIDDLLDYLGDQKKTGKKTGNDFIEGKMTLPLIRAFSSMSKDDQNALQQLLEGDRTKIEHYEAAKALVDKNGGFTSTRETAVELAEKAVAALEPFSEDTDSSFCGFLAGLTQYILIREK